MYVTSHSESHDTYKEFSLSIAWTLVLSKKRHELMECNKGSANYWIPRCLSVGKNTGISTIYKTVLEGKILSRMKLKLWKRVELRLPPCQGQASLLDCMPSVLGLEECSILCMQRKGQEPLHLHWLEGAKGSFAGGDANFLQPLLGCTSTLVVEEYRCVDSPLVSLRGNAVNF